jgi:hypothetical protein
MRFFYYAMAQSMRCLCHGAGHAFLAWAAAFELMAYRQALKIDAEGPKKVVLSETAPGLN